jgi:hypothetical protein
MKEQWEPANRTEIAAYRVLDYVLIAARGENPTPGYEVDIQQSLIKIFPPQYALVRRPLPGNWPQHVSPYRYAEVISYPKDQSTVRVHHEAGYDDVEIQQAGKQLETFTIAIAGREQKAPPRGTDQATGFSRNFSFDEAFADALTRLPELNGTTADQLATIHVEETGALIGGFAGFHQLFVRVTRTLS